MGIFLPGISPSPETRDIDALLSKLFNIHQIVFMIYIPLIIGVMIMSCFWGYTQSMVSNYTDKANDWQTCLMSTYYTVPLAEYVSIQQTSTQGCVFNQFFLPGTNCTGDDLPCIKQLQGSCLGGSSLQSEVRIPVGELLSSLSYLGVQTTIFSLASHAVLNRALRHPGWLGATIAFLIWAVWAILTYYTAAPVLPIPSQTNSTLVIMMFYAKKYVFDNFNNGDNSCGDAFKYVWLNITLVLCVIGLNIVCLVLGVIGELARQRAPNRKMYMPLQGTKAPIIACTLAGVFYFLTVFGKMYSSWTTINSIRDLDMSKSQVAAAKLPVWFDDSFFPFQVSSLDLNTISWVGSFMAVIRGYTRQSVSAFRLSAIMAFCFIITAYPGLIGALQFYKDNDFEEYDKCRDFFSTLPEAVGFGYPDADNAGRYCRAFRLSLSGYVGLFLMMHIIMVASSMTYETNRDRESAIFDPLDPHHPSQGGLDETLNAIRIQAAASSNKK